MRPQSKYFGTYSDIVSYPPPVGHFFHCCLTMSSLVTSDASWRASLRSVLWTLFGETLKLATMRTMKLSEKLRKCFKSAELTCDQWQSFFGAPCDNLEPDSLRLEQFNRFRFRATERNSSWEASLISVFILFPYSLPEKKALQVWENF